MSVSVNEPVRHPGRPRCEATEKAILAAARQMFETSNLRELTIDAIAKKAGVSKATIYRWWTNKADLVMDACLEELRQYATFDCKDGDPVDIITGQMRRLIKVYSGPTGRIVAQLMAEGQYQPEICSRFLAAHGEIRCNELQSLVGGEREKVVFLADLLYGPIYFRLIRHSCPLDEQFAERLTRQAAKWIAQWQAGTFCAA